MVAMETTVCDFGWKAPAFELPGVDGKRHSLAELRGDKGTLVMFICNHCPYVKAVMERIVRDTGALAEHGVASVAIMPNDSDTYPDDSFDNMQRLAQQKNFPFPYLFDESQDVARAYDAVCTPEFLGFNRDLELQYRGRLDESRTNAVPGARRELFEAMVQVADTGRGPKTQYSSIGCSIKWRRD